MKAEGINTDKATISADRFEQAMIHEALSQLAKQYEREDSGMTKYAEDLRGMAAQLEEVRIWRNI